MGKKIKLHYEGRTREQRIAVRKNLGSLKSLTVQPQTRARYETARRLFYQFIFDNQLTIPTQPHALDLLLADYLEHLWSTGEGRGRAADTLAAVQDLQPQTKGTLPCSWRLLRAWHVNEIPCRAPPLPESVLQAMLGWAFFHEDYDFALSLMIGFYSLLRTGELLDLRSNHIFIESAQKPATISLGLTKGGKRMGAAESVQLTVKPVLGWLKAWKSHSTPQQMLCPTSAAWRSKFNLCLTSLGVTDFNFRPYSLRRGGATYWFAKHGNLDRVVVLGRWQAQRTARIYINEGLAAMAEMALPKAKLKPFQVIYRAQFHKPRVT